MGWFGNLIHDVGHALSGIVDPEHWNSSYWDHGWKGLSGSSDKEQEHKYLLSRIGKHAYDDPALIAKASKQLSAYQNDMMNASNKLSQLKSNWENTVYNAVNNDGENPYTSGSVAEYMAGKSNYNKLLNEANKAYNYYTNKYNNANYAYSLLTNAKNTYAQNNQVHHGTDDSIIGAAGNLLPLLDLLS